jgi:putative ATPase
MSTSAPSDENVKQESPLAQRMRPRHINEFIGQPHLLNPGKPLYRVIQQGTLHSMILWGPPGTGKTTLAKIIAKSANATVECLSAVLTGVKDIRKIIEQAKQAKKDKRRTVLFVDEVHRFNKLQQDAFLPHVEIGTIILIGATTENPSFQVNNALLSRTRVYVLKPLSESHLLKILQNALEDKRGLGSRKLIMAPNLQKRLIRFADKDARQVLNLLEIISDFTEEKTGKFEITETIVNEVLSTSLRRFDHHGDEFYDQTSALHKSVRGSNPDAALYWLSRLLDGGIDPHYIARRLLRMASEDIGNADPRALRITLDAWETYERLGSPEGELALAQAVIYCACAPKSNATYTAFSQAMHDAKSQGSLPVPLHLRNAPTQLMRSLNYGKQYRYPHDDPDGFIANENYFPEKLNATCYYKPVDRGLEIKIKEKLEYLRCRNLTKSSSDK